LDRIVKRSDKLAFYGIPQEDGSYIYARMTGFTDISMSKNPKEFTRQYVDEDFEQTDIVGFSPAVSYSFDQYQQNMVHEDIINISDNELVGDEAVRPIIMVDMTKKHATENAYRAIKRDFSIIPESEGRGTDAYIYSGRFKVKGEKTAGFAASDDNFETITFTDE
jgi:hypothetical protein